MVALSFPALGSVSLAQVDLTPLGFLRSATATEPMCLSDCLSHLHFEHRQVVFLGTLAALHFLQETAGPLERRHKIPTLSLMPSVGQHSLWLSALLSSLYGPHRTL